jgi:ATP-dependent protease ClpP protease subunit
MIANIYIEGQIGNTYDGKKITKRGVTLLDVVEQVAQHPAEAIKKFIINSPGGYVTVGNEIADFISTLPNAMTHGVEQVASIATRIFLSVPVENRTIEEGTVFMIHNPWVGGVSGDAEELKRIADLVDKDEMELETFYSKATGIDKATLSALMRYDTELTASQCVKLGFAREVTKKELSPILALNYNKNQNEMTKEEKGLFQKLLAKVTGSKDEIVAIEVQTDGGVLSNDFADVQVNDPVKIDGEDNMTGTYTDENGVQYVVVDGIVTEIIEPVVASDEEVETLKAEIETLKAENATMVEAHKVELEARDANTKEIKAEIERIVALKSEEVPLKKETVFAKKKEVKKTSSFLEAKAKIEAARKAKAEAKK